MDDRIAEIRKALRWWDRMKDSTKWRPAIPVAFDAAQELVDLLDSDALIIRRDKSGEWPLDVVLALGRGVFEAESASITSNVSPDVRRHRYTWEQLILAGLDALASSQGVEPRQKWCAAHDQDWETGDCDHQPGACRLVLRQVEGVEP